MTIKKKTKATSKSKAEEKLSKMKNILPEEINKPEEVITEGGSNTKAEELKRDFERKSEAQKEKHAEMTEVLKRRGQARAEKIKQMNSQTNKPSTPKKEAIEKKYFQKHPFEFTLEELKKHKDPRFRMMNATVAEYLMNKDSNFYTPVKEVKEELEKLDVVKGKVKLFYSHHQKRDYKPFPGTYVAKNKIEAVLRATGLFMGRGAATLGEFAIEDIAIDAGGGLVFVPQDLEAWYKDMLNDVIKDGIEVPEKVAKALNLKNPKPKAAKPQTSKKTTATKKEEA